MSFPLIGCGKIGSSGDIVEFVCALLELGLSCVFCSVEVAS